MLRHKVYIVDYSGVPGRDNHRALFVATGGTSDEPEGPIFHVVGPTIDRQTKRAHMKFETKVRKPFRSATFVRKILVGEISGDKITDFQRIASNVPAPSRTMRQQRPNCVTWVANVLYKLNEESMVVFEEGFEVPSTEESLVG